MDQKQSSIDLGTNTCLLLVKQGDLILHDESNVVRLGQGVDQSRMLHPEAMERTLECLRKYASIVKRFGMDPSEVIAVGTAQARDAGNAADLIRKPRRLLSAQRFRQ